MHKWLIAALMLIAAMPCHATPNDTAGRTLPVTDPIRIVVQNQGVDQDDPDLAAWSPDERVILTMWAWDNDQVVLRDPTNGAVINRMTLPPGPDGATIVITSVRFDGGNTRAIATATAIISATASQDLPQKVCQSITYTIDLANSIVTQTAHPAACPPDTRVGAPDQLLATAPISKRRLIARTTGTTTVLCITSAAGQEQVCLDRPAGSVPALGLRAAAMAPDGHTLAVIADRNGGVEPLTETDTPRTFPSGEPLPVQRSALQVFDTTAMRFARGMTVRGSYTQVQWIDADHVLMTRRYGARERDVNPNMHEEDPSLAYPPPALVFDTTKAATTGAIAMRCYMAPLADGAFIGAALANCLAWHSDPPGGLERYVPGSGWSRLAPAVTAGGGLVEAIAVSPDRHRLGVIVRSAADAAAQFVVKLVDAGSGQTIDSLPLGKGWFTTGVVFEPGGHSLIVQTDARHQVWEPGSGKPAALLWTDAQAASGSSPDFMAANGRSVLASLDGGSTIARVRRASGAHLPDIALDRVVAFGFVPGKPQFWAASADDGVRFWNTRNWQPMQTIALFAGHHALAYMPDGRYDTDLSPDTATFRWRVADEPERLLGPQTFMRTYYTPRLLDRLETCILVSGGCSAAFPALPVPVTLNRALPDVMIDHVGTGPQPGTALVDVTVRAGHDPGAANAASSGLYDLRLFRNGSLVAEYPSARSDTVDETDAEWRAANAIAADRGVAHHRFVVPIASGAGTARVRFSAYAFNSDRIKSDTATARAVIAATGQVRPRRTFVLAIGIDAYAQTRLKLHYADNDAQAMATQLAKVPGPVDLVHTLTLADDRHPATQTMILAALDLLTGGDRAADLATLGLRASSFERTTPDDLVIISFSGHGWADRRGNFYLLPADAVWNDAAPLPALPTLLSSAALADAIKPIEARDIALVIDACHSAASVDTDTFKPGPMGDAGLGQLAWDKGIRILAAAARDDVAIEDARLRHGLLTYALTRQGLDQHLAARERDGRIMLDDWLRYALTAMPALSEAAQARTQARGHFTVMHDSQAVAARPRLPALFDFNHRPSDAVLRGKTP